MPRFATGWMSHPSGAASAHWHPGSESSSVAQNCTSLHRYMSDTAGRPSARKMLFTASSAELYACVMRRDHSAAVRQSQPTLFRVTSPTLTAPAPGKPLERVSSNGLPLGG